MRLQRHAVGLVGGLVFAATVVTIGSASTGTGDTIRACVRGSGVLALMRQGACGPKEETVEWNVQGPRGYPGPAGPPGPQSLATVLRQADFSVTLAPGEATVRGSICPTGEIGIGGGPTGWGGSLAPGYSTMVFDGVRSGWQVEFRNTGASPVTTFVRVGAICTRGQMTLG